MNAKCSTLAIVWLALNAGGAAAKGAVERADVNRTHLQPFLSYTTRTAVNPRADRNGSCGSSGRSFCRSK